MARKKSYNKPIMFPEAQPQLQELRLEIAKRLGYFTINADDWWEALTNAQKSEINGIVTKMMIQKAQQDMIAGKFR